MVRKLIAWAVHNPLVALLVAVALATFGTYAFLNINVEAYPDPAPAILEVVAQYPGASAEEVERLVTIPLEVALSGMPGLQSMRSKSLFGLAFLNCQFAYGTDHLAARQEVLNRMTMADVPQGVTPQISPRSPIGEIFRYTLSNPKDALGRPIYTLRDLKTLQNWTLVREFRRIPGVVDVVSFGGDVKRYEVRPDPERLKRYGITLRQLQETIGASNANVGGDYLVQGETVQVVRGLGLIGQGQDPAQDCARHDPAGGRSRPHPRRGAAADPRNPADRPRLDEQRPGPRRGCRRRGAAPAVGGGGRAGGGGRPRDATRSRHLESPGERPTRRGAGRRWRSSGVDR